MKINKLLWLLIGVMIIGSIAWYFLKPLPRDLNSVGFLFPDSMYDQTWGTEGYKGMLEIVQEKDIAFFYEQNVNSHEEITKAIENMSARNVNLLFGQGMEYARTFNESSTHYKDMHFVVFNGKSQADNVTAVNIDGYAMGFFCGMIASHQSKSGKIGIIAAYNTQPEVAGFIDGAQMENSKTEVIASYTKTFSYDSRGKDIASNMIKKGADVIFPAADGINADVMSLLKQEDIYAIGFIADQRDYGDHVLTSMMINLSDAYVKVAEEFAQGDLTGGTKYYGIDEKMVGLGELSYRIDDRYRNKIERDLKHFEKTHLLPNGTEPPQKYNERYLRTLK